MAAYGFIEYEMVRVTIGIGLMMISGYALAQLQIVMNWGGGHFALAHQAVRNWKTDKQVNLSVSAGLKGAVECQYLAWRWENRVQIELGLTYASDSEVTFLFPSENDLTAATKLVYVLGWKLDPFVAASLQTTPLRNVTIRRRQKQETARWWDPVISVQQMGLQYQQLTTAATIGGWVSINARQIRAVKHTQLTDDRRTKTQKERWYAEYGLEVGTSCRLAFPSGSWKIQTVGHWRANLHTNDRWKIDIISQLKVRFWQLLGVQLKAEFRYEPRVTKKVQYKTRWEIGLLW